MAINPGALFPAQTTPPSLAYPYGGAKNIGTPGDGTGTPWEAQVINDLFGFQQALLKAAAVIPNTTPEQVTDSQYLQAVVALASGRANMYIDDGTSAGINWVVDPPTDVEPPVVLFDGWTVAFRSLAQIAAPATINVAGIGAKPFVDRFGGNIVANSLMVGTLVIARYDLVNDRFKYVGEISPAQLAHGNSPLSFDTLGKLRLDVGKIQVLLPAPGTNVHIVALPKPTTRMYFAVGVSSGDPDVAISFEVTSFAADDPSAIRIVATDGNIPALTYSAFYIKGDPL